MSDEISDKIVKLMEDDVRRDFTVPEVMSALGVKNREKVVTALAELKGRSVVEVSREKGRAKFYRLRNVN